MHVIRRGLALGLCIFAAGCGMSRKEQLQQVARDWCLTVTASQIVPVYPLTEDLQPGDVFLVQMPIEEQRQRFDDDGFLPLDHHKARLTPKGYKDFYRDMFLMPPGGPERRFTGELQRSDDGTANWSSAPAAAFPSYSVSVSRSAGINAGIPLNGIPIGLSLLDAEQAMASVSIESARTLGVDLDSLSRDVEVWAALHEDALRPYARDTQAAHRRGWFTPKPDRNYLRVVSRIYVTGGVDISMADSRSTAGGLDAGQPRPVELLSPSAPDGLADVNTKRVENSRRAIAALNASLAESLQPSVPPDAGGDATAAAMDERTRAKLEKLKAVKEGRQKDLDAATEDLATKETEAAGAKAALREAEEKLRAAEKSLDDLLHATPRNQDAIKKATEARDAALADVKDKEKADPLVTLARAQGTADAARSALQQAGAMVPGMSVRVTAASSRMVSLRQDFNPPLIIGYIGFDREVLRDGRDGPVYLGPPVATTDRLLPDRSIPADPSDSVLVVQSANSPRAASAREAIRAWNTDGTRRQQIESTRKELFPDTEAIHFASWLQSATAARLEAVMKKLNIPSTEPAQP